MSDSELQIVTYLLAAVALGALAGWYLQQSRGRRQVEQLSDEWQTKVDNVSRQRDRLTAENSSLRTTIESQQATVHKHEVAMNRGQTELASAREKEKLLTKDLFTLRSEREDFKSKISTFQNALVSVKQQASEIQAEFIKSREFYKGELTKSFEKRKLLEAKIKNAQFEYESFNNLLQASRSEQESVNRMLTSARTRLGNLDALEQTVIELEAENAQLRHDATLMKQENEGLHWDVAELEELKVQNKELAHCLTSIENSRKQYEDDAKRYREHAGESEKQSETLRLKLDEVEKNFFDIANQQRAALQDARKDTASRKANGRELPAAETDNLQEIVGIGKAFEKALHDLGICSFRQIAAFDVSDIARVNAELKEFKGRMEQDDWVGQAKELLFKKYSQAS